MKLVHYTQKTLNYFILFAFTLLIILSDNISVSHAASVKLQCDLYDVGEISNYTGKTDSVSLDKETISLKKFPAIQINDIWLVPVKALLIDKLDFTMVEKDNKISVTNPYMNSTIIYTIGSDTAVCNNKELELSVPVAKCTNTETKKYDYYVPAESAFENFGFSYSETSKKIELTTIVKYNLYEEELDYDNSKYSNIINNITISDASNKKDKIVITALNKTSSDSITIKEDKKNHCIEVVFKKTRNPFDEILQDIDDCSITKIEAWESDNFNTHIKITYGPYLDCTYKLLSNGFSLSTKKAASFSVKFFLPDNVKYSALTTVDEYWKNRFIIKVPGNYKSFYNKYKPMINNSSLKKTETKISGKYTEIIVYTTKLLGYKLSSDNGSVTIKVGNPKSIYPHIVLFDAGHGGKDSGACANGLKEKELNLEIIYNRLEKYFNSPSSDIKAYWTRNDDTFINLYERPKLTKKYEADLFVSLHMNSSSNKSANGTEVYYSKVNTSSFDGLTSKEFASVMLNSLVSTLKSTNRGVKQAGFVVNKYNSVPSILIELGFVTGSSDKNKLKNSTYKENASKAIYNGLVNVFDNYSTGR